MYQDTTRVSGSINRHIVDRSLHEGSIADASAIRVQLVVKPATTRTGIGRYTLEMASRLPRLGVEMTQAGLTRPFPSAVSRLARRAGYDLDAFNRSYPLRAETQRGVLTHLTSQFLGVLLLTQRLPRPVVITVHDILPYLLRDDSRLTVYSTRVHRLMDALAMRGLRRADRLMTDSIYTKQTLIDTLDISSERIDVVHLGVDSERFRPRAVPRWIRDTYQLPETGQYALFVGSEDPRKNVPLLLRAFAELSRAYPNLILLKVGAPAFDSQRDAHLRLCDELEIAGRVRWFDDIPEEHLPYFYNMANVFTFPSLYEGFGFPVLEALASGTPVVAVRASSVTELAGDASTLLDDPSPSAFAAAVRDRLEGSRPDPETLRAHALRFDWTTTALKTVDTYRHVILDGGPR